MLSAPHFRFHTFEVGKSLNVLKEKSWVQYPRERLGSLTLQRPQSMVSQIPVSFFLCNYIFLNFIALAVPRGK